MKNFLNSKIFSALLFSLIVGVITKVIWLTVAILFLPKSGVEHIEISKAKPLFYRIKLATKVKEPPKPKSKPKHKLKPKAPTVISMKGIKLIALYNSSHALVVTVEKAKKTKVLSKGEDIDGFILNSAGPNYAVFKKNNKKFKLILGDDKIEDYLKKVKSSTIKSKPKPKKKPKSNIVENEYGDGKIVSKDLLNSYTKNIEKVWKDIGIDENKVNGQLQGFKINFVKKGSDLEKLGLRRGDILKAVNGDELNSYKSAYSFYGEIGTMENLTLSIIRNNQDMELEYEIK